MDDLKDKLNYLIMKFLFVLLNILAIFGFLDSLRPFEKVCNVLVILFSSIVLIINVVGFSVFETKMMTDKTSDMSLLNHLYTMMSIIGQIRSILMFILVIISTYFEEYESLKVNIYLSKLFFTLLSIGNMVALTASSWVKQKNPTKYFHLSQSKVWTWSMLAGQIMTCVIIFGLLSTRCLEEEEYFCIEKSLLPIGGIPCVFCLIILVKITAENHHITPIKIIKYLKTKVYSLLNNKIIFKYCNLDLEH